MGKSAVAKKAQRVAKKPVVKKAKRVATQASCDRIKKSSFKTALVASLKAESRRKDLAFDSANKGHAKLIKDVPLDKRAGYPLVRTPGAVDPKNWKTVKGVSIMVDFNRFDWLPDSWGQGVKITTPTAHSTGGGGGTYTVIIAPDGKNVFYHRSAAEAFAGHKFNGGVRGLYRTAQLQAESVQISNDSDESLFKVLSPAEKKCLAPKADFHFAVVSARRADKPEGIKDIATVQTAIEQAGLTPRWYVDKASLEDYKKLGLDAVVGGPLTAARNLALSDAKKMGKVCVQLSDDISAWEYRHGDNAKENTDLAKNRAFEESQRFIVSPVAAARFILAKMRALPDAPKLGGVYMLGSCSRTFYSAPVSRYHFLLGDFLVVEPDSPCKFDESMTLKEDYDFTCSHIKKHGSILRLNRMCLRVKHYANAGGAVDNRDKKGEKERNNIAILNRKWPGCFRPNHKRANEVILRWKGIADADADDSEEEEDANIRSMKASKRAKNK